MAEESPKAEPAPEPQAAKGGKGKLIVIIGVVVLLAGGGGAAWFLGFIPHGAKPAEAEAKVDGAEPKDGPGALHALEPFIANLADEDGKRYLRTVLQVEFFDAKVPPEFTARLPQIRDLLLTLFTSKSFPEIRTPQGKALLREDVINRMNRVFQKDLVKAVYFTEFIVQ
jgi:flagellar protein FliL